ncbi:hypothetical protein M513_02548 [Trichuris suis]|uniref:Uncharacterized protein n=1 Tax=Trichuris suis TaxID=68888 RepID=A0A085MGU8_9BILA|nr:hypothetical protein M513_02548 [Trichuris suis]
MQTAYKIRTFGKNISVFVAEIKEYMNHCVIHKRLRTYGVGLHANGGAVPDCPSEGQPCSTGSEMLHTSRLTCTRHPRVVYAIEAVA